jgi:SAM-dependent methyltransferase
MQVFDSYARYYDLLYRDKEYEKEASFVASLLTAHQPSARSLLELGCGTGRHALLLAQSGYEVTAIDRSEEMLSTARKRSSHCSGVSFVAGDIRSISLGTTFDACISLFHVMSYLTDNNSLSAAFRTAANHIVPGGIFIFDCWYGPGVLADPPCVRVKRLEDDSIAVTRIAEPVMHRHDNLVEVNYEVLIREKASGNCQKIQETHVMRYLFAPEVVKFAEDAGMIVEKTCEWMTGEELPDSLWYACFVLRKFSTTNVNP